MVVFPPLSVYTVYSELPVSANVPRSVEKVTEMVPDSETAAPSLSKRAAVIVDVLKPLAGMLVGLALRDIVFTDDELPSSPALLHEITNISAHTKSAPAKPFWRYLIFIPQLLMPH